LKDASAVVLPGFASFPAGTLLSEDDVHSTIHDEVAQNLIDGQEDINIS
jgi:hypothetical protein